MSWYLLSFRVQNRKAMPNCRYLATWNTYHPLKICVCVFPEKHFLEHSDPSFQNQGHQVQEVFAHFHFDFGTIFWSTLHLKPNNYAGHLPVVYIAMTNKPTVFLRSCQITLRHCSRAVKPSTTILVQLPDQQFFLSMIIITLCSLFTFWSRYSVMFAQKHFLHQTDNSSQELVLVGAPLSKLVFTKAS